MVVFRHPERYRSLGELLRKAETSWGLGRAMAWAQLEQALSDFWNGNEDDWDGRQAALTGQTVTAARQYLGASAGASVARPPLPPLPEASQQLRIGNPEGLRYYGLWPAGWAQAARQWQAQTQEPVWILGLRTMGSLLGAMAMAGLSPVAAAAHRFSTLRPRGHPADRRIRANRQLQVRIGQWPGRFLIVDEGPGLSGSSFGGVMRWLRELGVTPARITLLASWRPAAEQLSSPDVRANWDGWQVITAAPLPALAGREIGGGAWRRTFRRWAPVWGEHERRKILLVGGETIARFAGFGPYGAAVRERADTLGRAGWGPEVMEGLGEGWIGYRRLRAVAGELDRSWAESAGRYLAWLAANCRLGYGPPTTEMRAMVETNLGASAADSAPDGPLVMLDGRQTPVKWLRTSTGWRKLDGTDHGDDPFFPGPADVAWDLAALTVESSPALGALALRTYEKISGDRGRGLARRVAWHRQAYLAFRQAYCQLAQARTDGRDAKAFCRLAQRYALTLARIRQHQRVCTRALKP